MILDIARLLLQKDTRDSLKELVRFVKKKPEWKADLFTVAAKFSYSEDKEAGTFVRFVHEVLLQKGWPPKRAGVAEFVLQELVDNAFLHGCPPPARPGPVRVSATVTAAWVCLRVTDRGSGFDLESTLRRQVDGEGRGLLRIRSLASNLVQEDPNTIEATVRAAPGVIDVALIDDVHVVSLQGRLTQDAVDFDRAFAVVGAASGANGKVLIDLSETEYASSVALRFLSRLHRRNVQRGYPSVLVLREDSAVAEILKVSRLDILFHCVGNRAEGIARLVAA